MKYYIFEVIEHNGEQEYRQRILEQIEGDPDQRLKELCYDWYSEWDEDECTEEEYLKLKEEELENDGHCSFLLGTIIVEPGIYREVTKREYNILKKYI